MVLDDADSVRLPESLKKSFRKSLLEQARVDDGLGVFELSLFEFYLKEKAVTIERMLSSERSYVEEQMSQGIDMVNDSGIVAAEYFTRRIRYADLIYLCSLLETFLESACKKVELVRAGEVHFAPVRGQGKWLQCAKFLETQGGFTIPGVSEGILKSARIVRNCIAHDNGDTAGLSASEREILFSEIGLNITGAEIVVEHEFVNNAFAAFKELVEKINAELKRLIDLQLSNEGAGI